MATDSPLSFDDLLRRARRAAGLTQEELAERAGLSVRAISDLERGVYRAPRRDTLDLLADALALPPADRAAWERVRRSLATRSPPAPSPTDTIEWTPGHLPAPLSSFVGREADVASVAGLVQRPGTRLVTLTGTGGVGKTRLALAIARRLQTAFRDEVWFIDLAPVSDPSLVLSTVATSLGVTTAANQSVLDALVTALRDRQMLLIVDNVEQVVTAAPSIRALVEACPQLSVLATSRVPLRVEGEQVYPTVPLTLPEYSHVANLTLLADVEAVALFIQRAQVVRPDFTLSDDHLRIVAQITQRLDGLPLAIELAAARVRLLPPRALLDKLEQRLSILKASTRDVPDRHLTLRTTIAWSHDLLTSAEQTLFRRLSVFRGGWTMEAAEEVACDLQIDVLEALGGLIDHSLVDVRELADGTARYTMLETIREYGIEQLVDAGEGDETRRHHLRYYMDFAERCAEATRGPQQALWLNRTDDEHNNLRAALQWSLEHDPVAGLQLSSALSEYWFFRGMMAEGRDWLEEAWSRATHAPQLPQTIRARALLFRSEFRYVMGDYATADRLLDESIALSRQAEDRFGTAVTLFSRGRGARMQGDLDTAYTLTAECLAIFQEINNLWGIAGAHAYLGVIAHRQGKLAEATALLERALAMDRAQNDLLGVVVWLTNLGLLAIDERDYDRAAERFREALEVNREVQHARDAILCLEGLAMVAGLGGDSERAARLFGAASVLREVTSIRLAADEVGRYERHFAIAKSKFDEQQWNTAWQTGREMSLTEAVDAALHSDLFTA